MSLSCPAPLQMAQLVGMAGLDHTWAGGVVSMGPGEPLYQAPAADRQGVGTGI